jgi:hypothetical protein
VIYDCPVWQLIADAANDVSQPYTADAIDGWFRENFPKIKPGTVAAHIRGLTANDPSRHHYPPLAAKPPLFFRTASGDLVCFDADSHTSETAIAAAARPARRRRQAGLHGPRTYIDVRVTTSIQALPDTRRFDHTKLLKLMAELDDNFARSNAYAAHALLRAILDHIPPMLSCTSFTAVANNYPWTRTDKGYMHRLLDFRIQADDVLHRQISRRSDLLSLEDMPPRACVNRLLQECASASIGSARE